MHVYTSAAAARKSRKIRDEKYSLRTQPKAAVSGRTRHHAVTGKGVAKTGGKLLSVPFCRRTPLGETSLRTEKAK